MQVLVLGAGVVGVTSAYYLAKAGHDVTVVERCERAGLGTSYANGGQVLGASVTPWVSPSVPGMMLRNFGRADAPYLIHLRPEAAIWKWAAGFLRNCTPGRVAAITAVLKRLAIYSRDSLATLRDEEGIDYLRNAGGLLHLYRSPRAFARAVAAARDQPGMQIVPGADACRAFDPALADSRVPLVGGIHDAEPEVGDCHVFTENLAAVAARSGVAFEWNTSVTALHSERGNVWGIGTRRGRMEAEAVLVCLGSESRHLLRDVGVRLPIYPVKGYGLTIPVEDTGLLPRVALHDDDRKMGITPLGNSLRIAGTAELDGYRMRMRASRSDALVAAAKSYFPAIDGDGERWVGLRPMTPDCVPIIGPSPIRGLFLNTGHGSLGWTLACGSARMISDIMSGNPPAIDQTGLGPERYH